MDFLKKAVLLLVRLACILFFIVMLRSSSLVLHYARKGIAVWAETVLPLLLPFIILSKLWICCGIPEMFFYAAGRIFPKNKFLAVSLPLFTLGICSGFPIGAVFVSHYYKEGILKKSEAEQLLPLVSFVSPMFVSGYVRPLLGVQKTAWFCCLAALYLPVLLFYLKICLESKAKEHTAKAAAAQSLKKKKGTADRSLHAAAVFTSSLQIIFIIGVYMMLFSVLFGLLTRLGLCALPGMPFLLANLEVTTGLRFLSEHRLYFGYSDRLYLLCMLGVTAFGGLCTMAQIQTAVSDTDLSMKTYALGKLKTGTMTVLIALVFMTAAGFPS